MTAFKLYVAEDRDYLDMTKWKSFEDINQENFGGNFPYSEFQRPYWNDDNEPTHTYWEWGFPPIEFPGIPPTTIPDIPENPCSMDGSCQWAKVIGSESINKCGMTHTYTQMHFWLGCEVAPWWAAYGSWSLEGGDGVELVSQGPVMASVYIEENAPAGVFQICYYGPGCTDCMDVTYECGECCAEFTLTGADTVDPGSTWTGTIDPACPTAKCSVSSNSGCSLACTVNGSGSEVTVTPGVDDCGAFTVTVWDEQFGCIGSTAEKVVRITDGSWGGCYSKSYFGCIGPHCSCDYEDGKYKVTVNRGSGIQCGGCDTPICNGENLGEYCSIDCVGCVGSYGMHGIAAYEWGCTC